MLKTMTPPMSRNQRDDSPRRDRWGGVSATWGGATCSLDTLAPHTGARLDAALESSLAGRQEAGGSNDLRNRLTSLAMNTVPDPAPTRKPTIRNTGSVPSCSSTQ